VEDGMNRQQWQDWVTLVIGIWIFISPWLFAGAVGAVAWNFYIVGVLVAALALAALFAFQVWEEWVNVVLGVWLIVSPWALGFSGFAPLTWNAVIAGLLVVVFSGWRIGIASRAEETY
jgi:hypothetical protein